MNNMNIPCFVIAGTNSGCGKTTISLAIMSAIYKRNLKIQPFKIGPDYIDTMLHSFITNRDGRNLDAFLFNENTLKYIFCENSKNVDLAICEGVMGLYDGIGDTSISSTAHVSKIIKSPVIIVINAKGMALSIVAIIKGFIDFDRSVNICGVILNNIKSEMQYNFIKSIIEKNIHINVLGYFREIEEIKINSRHLGLTNACEIENLKHIVDIMSYEAEKTINIDRIIELSKNTNNIDYFNILDENLKNRFKGLKIGVAYDKAFNFYYKDNIDFLKFLGIDILFFSPMNDYDIPDVDALYIGGGYPELFASQLENNISIINSINNFVNNNGFIYAECGGLIYMSKMIQTLDNKKYNMTGILNGYCKMTDRLNHFGYVNIFDKYRNLSINGHEFHYSTEFIDNDTIFNVSKKRGDNVIKWDSGYKYKNVIASYPHIHFYSNIDFVVSFIEGVAKKCSII